MSLSPEREQEIRDDDATYTSVKWLGADRRDLLGLVDSLRQERDSLKQKVWGLEQAVEIVRARSFEQQIEDLERQVKIAVDALKYVAVQRGGRPINVCTEALSEIEALKGESGER